MCVLLFDTFNGCSVKVKACQAFTTEKNWHSQNFDILGKKIWRNALALKSKKVEDTFGETFILELPSSAAFRMQNLVSDFF